LSADELENLTIRAGTLTSAERGVINNHIVATIKMLEQLPWPKHLKNVPEYAGGHHERMDGKGLPQRIDPGPDVGAGPCHGYCRYF
jgi:HD-GYP domain-containing protein (c-di-GMP phosphodiesterase class II)